jgi:heme oxygenase
VKSYLEHLKKIENENPLLLAAYIYHLYMGLLSGGQILAKKRGVKASLGLGNHFFLILNLSQLLNE